MELHRLIMSTLGGHGGLLEIDREKEMDDTDNFKDYCFVQLSGYQNIISIQSL